MRECEYVEEVREKLGKMTTGDYLTRILELQRALEWRDEKIAEQETTIARLRTLLDEARAKLRADEVSGDSLRDAGPTSLLENLAFARERLPPAARQVTDTDPLS